LTIYFTGDYSKVNVFGDCIVELLKAAHILYSLLYCYSHKYLLCVYCCICTTAYY